MPSRTDPKQGRSGGGDSGALGSLELEPGAGTDVDLQDAHLPPADSGKADSASIGTPPDANASKLAVIAHLEPDLCKMLSHPLRSRIFWRLGDGQASASEIAREFDCHEQVVRDHIKTLKKHGLVELVEVRSGERGGRQYIYRAVDRLIVTAEEWATLPASVQSTSETEITRKLHGEMIAALEAGTLQSDPDHVLVRRPTLLDQAGKKRVDRIMLKALDEIIEAERESAERCARSGEKPQRLIQGLTSFVAAPAAPDE